MNTSESFDGGSNPAAETNQAQLDVLVRQKAGELLSELDHVDADVELDVVKALVAHTQKRLKGSGNPIHLEKFWDMLENTLDQSVQTG